MNETKNTWKSPVIAIVVLVMVAVAGYMYTGRDRTSDELIVGTTSDEASSVDGDLLKTLGKLKKLQLSNAIWSDPVWLNLRDFGRTLSPEPKGRQNPFAPLSQVSQ